MIKGYLLDGTIPFLIVKILNHFLALNSTNCIWNASFIFFGLNLSKSYEAN
jgi:hypothetical protein